MHYGLGYRELMALPIKTFWMLNKNVNRLLAEKDLRALSMAINSQSNEGVTALREKLSEELGNPYGSQPVDNPLDEERDEAGFEMLKNMM